MNSACLCLILYTLSLNMTESVMALNVIFASLTEIFSFCWMGSRVFSRIEDLSAVIYGMNWDFMIRNQRNDLKLVLLMTQNMKHSMEFSDPSTWKLS